MNRKIIVSGWTFEKLLRFLPLRCGVAYNSSGSLTLESAGFIYGTLHAKPYDGGVRFVHPGLPQSGLKIQQKHMQSKAKGEIMLLKVPVSVSEELGAEILPQQSVVVMPAKTRTRQTRQLPIVDPLPTSPPDKVWTCNQIAMLRAEEAKRTKII